MTALLAAFTVGAAVVAVPYAVALRHAKRRAANTRQLMAELRRVDAANYSATSNARRN